MPVLLLACGHPAAGTPPQSVPEAAGGNEPRAPATTPSATEPSSPPTPTPSAAATPVPDEPPVPYPTVYCGFPNDVGDRWEIGIDPQTKDDRRRAARLLDAYPDADGYERKLARTNLPPAYHELDEVTVLAPGRAAGTKVRAAGVRPSPSDGHFVLVLDVRPKALPGQFGLVVASADAPAGLQPVARDGSDAKLSPDGPVDLRRFMRRDLDRGGVDDDAGARFEAVGKVDLDGDGLDEVVVHEHWSEGLFVWLVRWHADVGQLRGTFVCGDAS